ncbi:MULTISPECIES: hypothetical protein [unclassified Hyphomonas]|jgi:hypothetical protein|nr:MULTISPECIES: hypothetical protein [unclassified Hyphomonas]KCZ62237.1 hypothetical protein L53_13430 [Hyphomonas sp. L-53-1-40]MBO6582938.1 hypothetical protein [Hyphomonas sp.]|tara:strand:- start:566 stop:703 length:138 start_codon:yes stop_codon:yes gene_type:complete
MNAIIERRQRRCLLRRDMGAASERKTLSQVAAQRRRMRIPGGGGN